MSGQQEHELSKAYGAAIVALLIPIPLAGLHHFYLGRAQTGLLYTLTMGFCGWGTLYDLFRMRALVNEANNVQSSGNIQRSGPREIEHTAAPRASSEQSWEPNDADRPGQAPPSSWSE